jgi:glycosyltransferase involved in cell wall biosynthesis
MPNLRWKSVGNGGPGQARNIGAAMASKGIVLFLGDDIQPANDDFFRVHAELHTIRPEQNLAVLGKVVWPNRTDLPVEAAHRGRNCSDARRKGTFSWTLVGDTFMSVNRSKKLRIPFVQGKFNAGGDTGVLQFCGEKNMQLIVSRRHPEDPVEPWGFTIVRRMKPTAGRRSSMYVYLAPGGDVPRFAAAAIKVLPENRSSLTPKPSRLMRN